MKCFEDQNFGPLLISSDGAIIPSPGTSWKKIKTKKIKKIENIIYEYKQIIWQTI